MEGARRVLIPPGPITKLLVHYSSISRNSFTVTQNIVGFDLPDYTLKVIKSNKAILQWNVAPSVIDCV